MAMTSAGIHPPEADELLDEVRKTDWRMLANGRLTEGSGGRLEVIDPATEEVLAEVPDPTATDIDGIVRAADAAFEGWRRSTPRDRAKIIRSFVPVLREHAEELARLDALDSGSPVTSLRADVTWSIDLLEVLCDAASELRGETIPASAGNLHYTRREPFGVVARIIPFNHPLFFTVGKIVAPLVAGNTVVLKAPDQAPLTALRLGELFADLLPPGVLNIVAGRGALAGDALVRHPLVRRIAFIGSAATGQRIQANAAEAGVKTVTLELGGKNPMIVFPDADPARVAAGAVAGMNFGTQGESCGSTSRLLLHESIADEVIERVVALTAAVRVGSPLDEASRMGPIVSQRQYDHVTSLVRSGLDEGAVLATGGARPDGDRFARGYWLSPTVFTGVDQSMRIAREEIFGPVLSILTWSDEASALRIANDVEYGLTASVWTNDLRTAHRVAAELEAGYIWVNGSSRHFWGTAFGGYKSSGVGREEGLEELMSFTQTKTVNVMLEP
jgi:2-formylbenzoate dehydrogenase